MTPSESAVKTMTDAQIEKAVDKVRNAFRKHRSEIGSDVAQQVLGVENLGMLMFAPFRERTEVISKLIVRSFKTSGKRSFQEALDATGRKQYTDRKVVNAVSPRESEEGEVVFFNLGRYVNDDNLEKEYELRGLKPADPYSLAAVNEADPAFADKKPNGTHWKDADGKWCFATFFQWRGGRRSVSVGRSSYDWNDGWWFAGVRK